MPRINVEDARAIPVPLPPLPEQHEIVRRVSALFALAKKIEARLSAATAAVNRITQSVLAEAFRGDLVETEASIARREGRDYELATKLLESVNGNVTAAGFVAQKRNRLAKRKSG
jgi:type I restriction enzyme S subunit